jgi:hypothetical protein
MVENVRKMPSDEAKNSVMNIPNPTKVDPARARWSTKLPAKPVVVPPPMWLKAK